MFCHYFWLRNKKKRKKKELFKKLLPNAPILIKNPKKKKKNTERINSILKGEEKNKDKKNWRKEKLIQTI